MIGIGSMVKWGIALAMVSMLAVGVSKGYEYHLDQIDSAVVSAQRSIALASAEVLTKREKELRALAIADKKKVQKELRVERAKVTDLQRMLLIDHDLDKDLQQHPDMILLRVNKGTEAYFKALEEATQ